MGNRETRKMKTQNHRNRLWEAYRTSFKNFTLAAGQLQNVPASDTIAREMALAEAERARAAYSRSRDALVPALLPNSATESFAIEQHECAACCA